jgi:hypothetical protein
MEVRDLYFSEVTKTLIRSETLRNQFVKGSRILIKGLDRLEARYKTKVIRSGTPVRGA